MTPLCLCPGYFQNKWIIKENGEISRNKKKKKENSYKASGLLTKVRDVTRHFLMTCGVTKTYIYTNKKINRIVVFSSGKSQTLLFYCFESFPSREKPLSSKVN